MSGSFDAYFAAEAREHLDQLEALLAQPDEPDAERMLRLSTGVRSGAQRANAETVASVAERLEDAARSILSGNIAWSDEIRALAAQTVGDLKLLLRALNRWGVEEERRVRTAIERWDEHDGGATAASPQAPARANRTDEPAAPNGEDAAEVADSADAAGLVDTPETDEAARPRQAAEGGVVPITDLFYDDEGPHILLEGSDTVVAAPGDAAPPDHGATMAAASPVIDSATDADPDAAVPAGPPPDDDLVPITTLLLRGDAALRAALALRPELEAIVRGDPLPARPLAMLIDELFDLLELARDEPSPEA